MTGLLGGLWLHQLQESATKIEFAGWDLTPFQLLFLISWIGRVSATFWILPIREPQRRVD